MSWTRRAVYAGLSGLAAWGFAAWVGLNPRPALVLAATIATFAVGWLIADLSPALERFDWTPPHASALARYGHDRSFSRLARSFTDGTDTNVVAAQVHAILLRCIDDRLATHHGIDRTARPEEAQAVLGAEIWAYLTTPPRVRRHQIDFYRDLLTRIEAL